MQEAMRQSVEDQGRQHDGSYYRDYNARGSRDGTGGSDYGNAPQVGSQNIGGNHGPIHYGQYGGSSQGGSQYYSELGGVSVLNSTL